MAGFADAEVRGLVGSLHAQIMEDRDKYKLMRDYHRGRHMKPKLPTSVDPQMKELVDRATTNLMRLAVNIPAQLSFIDGYSRVGPGEDEVESDPEEWQTWIASGFRAQQTNVFRTSLKYGQAFVMVDNEDPDDVRLRLLPTRQTTAFFADPVNDRVPTVALTIRDLPGDSFELIYCDEERVVTIPGSSAAFHTFDSSWLDTDEMDIREHGLGECPVIRFTCELDDEGNATGIVEPLIPAQNRVNQTAFDLLVDQTYGSFGVRWAAGLAGEPIMDEKGEPLRDENGFLQFKPMEVSQSQILMTDNPNAKFGTLESTPLDGFIAALDNAIRTFAVMGNIPPHSLLGSMSNLSGETIEAAMGQTNRFTHMLKVSWAESTEELMRLVRTARGIEETEGADYQVRWREMSDQSIAQIVDALGKASQMLAVPGEGLWPRIPGTTDAELRKWRALASDAQNEAQYEVNDAVTAAAREPATLNMYGQEVSDGTAGTDRGVAAGGTGSTGGTVGAPSVG